MSDGITHFEGNYDELMATIKSKSGLVVVVFFATWCGPCQRLGQLLPSIAKDNSDVTFIKVDIDKNQTSASEFGVKSVPHVIFYKDQKVLDQIVGADVPGIKANIAKFK